MPGMRDQFSHFYIPGDEAIATAMKTGLVVPDANVLLNLYRFQRTARDELFGALEKVSDRLWVPHQVALEFQRNRLGVMKEQEGYFDKTMKELNDSIDALQGRVRAFRARIALDEDDRWHENIETRIAVLRDHIGRQVTRAQRANEVRLNEHALDSVLDRIDALFENRVGMPLEPKELEDTRKEADRRVKEKIPPGYMDRRKDDPAGDFIVWRQLMTEAVSRKLPVVFVTDDTKEDWVRREHGLTLGARYELREEIVREAGVPLLMMTTETFLRHAKTYLDATVSEETVDQAKELPAEQIDGVRLWDLLAELRSMPPDRFESTIHKRLSAGAEAGNLSQGETTFLLGLILNQPKYGEAGQRALRDLMSSGALDEEQNAILRALGRDAARRAARAAAGQTELELSFNPDDEADEPGDELRQLRE